MSESNREFQDLLENVSGWERRQKRLLYISLAIPILLAVALLTFVTVKTYQMQRTVDRLSEEIKQKELEAAQLQEKIDSAQKVWRDVGFSFDKDFKWDPNDLLDKSGESARESKLAHEKIMENLMANKINVETLIRYYGKKNDKGLVETTLKKCGFRSIYIFSGTQSEQNPTNTISFSRDVSIDDVKIVAFAMIRAGLKVKRIQQYSSSVEVLKKGSIEIAGESSLVASRTISFSEISNATAF